MIQDLSSLRTEKYCLNLTKASTKLKLLRIINCILTKVQHNARPRRSTSNYIYLHSA